MVEVILEHTQMEEGSVAIKLFFLFLVFVFFFFHVEVDLAERGGHIGY